MIYNFWNFEQISKNCISTYIIRKSREKRKYSRKKKLENFNKLFAKLKNLRNKNIMFYLRSISQKKT